MATLKHYYNKYITTRSPGFPFGRTGTGPRPTDDLTPSTRDALFSWQMRGEPHEDFGCLTADSLLQAKICETRFYANSVLRSCHTVGVIDKVTGNPDTTKIDSSMVNKIAIISVPKQRELINMLFFWEEEMTRWRLLSEEERELVSQIEVPEIEDDVRAALEHQVRVIKATMRIPPSKRLEDGQIIHDDLPSYDESREMR